MAFESFGGGGGGRTRYMGSDDKKSMNNYYNLHGNDEIQRNKEKSYTIPVNLGSLLMSTFVESIKHLLLYHVLL